MASPAGNFIVKISNLPKDTSRKILNDIIALAELGNKYVFTLEKELRRAYLYVRNEKLQKVAVLFFNSLNYKGDILKAEYETKYDPKEMKSGKLNASDTGKCEELSLEKRVENVVTPYAHMPYTEQLKLKQEKAEKAIKDLTIDMLELNPRLKKFILFQRNLTGGLVCPVDEIVPSPVIDHYRNKCEFSIGKSDGKTVVGFAVGNEKLNSIEIGPVMHLKHINQQMKRAVQYFEEYLQNSPHEPFSPITESGVWRQMAVRTTSTGDFIIIIHVHPQRLIREELDLIEDQLLEFFISKTKSDNLFKPSAIYYQERGQLTSGEKPVLKQVYGNCKFIQESILDNSFRASPDSFLQINTAACEVLYKKIQEIAEVTRKTAVLDICCGVGTIGVSIAKDAGQLIGVDFIEGAIEHANFNAKINNVPCNNTSDGCSTPIRRYYHGKAEDYISIMLRESKQYDVLAILDPPRAGIGNHVIHSVRMNDSLNKLIYVSCDAEQARGNFRTLTKCRSKNTRGECFIPIRVIPVDMFPHTKHLEIIILFEKYDAAKWEKIMLDNANLKDEDLSKLAENIKQTMVENTAGANTNIKVSREEEANPNKRKTEFESPENTRKLAHGAIP